MSQLQVKEPWIIIGCGRMGEIVYECVVSEADHKLDNGYLGSHNIYTSKDLDAIREKYDVEGIACPIQVLLCIGYSDMNEARASIYEILESCKGFRLVSWISKDSWTSESCNIGKGSIVLPMTIIEPGCNLGVSSIIWYGSHIAHDSDIGDFAWIAAKAAIGAGCKIGGHVFLAIGAVVPSNSSLGEYVLVCAGCVSPTHIASDQVVKDDRSSPAINAGKTLLLKSKELIRFL